MSDTIQIDEREAYKFDLVSEVSLCYGKSLTLIGPSNKPQQVLYSWSNGSHADSVLVDKAGYVWLESSLTGCTFRDSVRVVLKACTSIIPYVPNAFTPNDDSVNDLFKPIFSLETPITEYSFTVFSRWGSILFITTDLHAGWNGIYMNEPSVPGEYAYKIRFSYLDNNEIKSHEKAGEFLLIR